MQHLRDWIAEIEDLIVQDSPRSLTYAALECRLAIEYICYERLKGSYGNYAFGDLKGKWQPRNVIRELIREVDGSVASSFKLSISKEPAPDVTVVDQEEFQSLDFVEVGYQVGFDPKKLGDMWNALSNIALHVQMPKTATDQVNRYGDADKITKTLNDTVAQLRRIAQGTMISAGIGVSISFDCPCGAKVSRRARSLTEGQVISCSNPDCKESYIAHTDGENWTFEHENLIFPCDCGNQMKVPPRFVNEIPRGKSVRIICSICERQTMVQWMLNRACISPSDVRENIIPTE